VLIFAIVFMVTFGVWYTPLLNFASSAVPNLTSNITQVSSSSPAVTGGIVGGGAGGAEALSASAGVGRSGS
jgi:hypothetical protein